MVKPMTEQSGNNEPSDRQGQDQPATDGAGSGQPANDRPESARPESARPESARPESGRPVPARPAPARPVPARPVSGRPGSGKSGSDRPRQSAPGADMLSDLQRWLIRSGAKSMRKEISGQVRRTFSGGQRSATVNVWDTATTEIPPDAGESPECQWCPICRAARLMRESGPGIGGQLSGAGEVVASAVQDAVSALDSILGKAGGSRVSDSRSAQPRAGDSRGTQPRTGQPGAGDPRARASWSGQESARTSDSSSGTEQRPGSGDHDPAGQGAAGPDEVAQEHHDDAPPHGSAAGDHGPGGWKPGDRLATAQSAEPDAWAAATEPDDGAVTGTQPDAESASPPAAEHERQLDGPGHEPDDRG